MRLIWTSWHFWARRSTLTFAAASSTTRRIHVSILVQGQREEWQLAKIWTYCIDHREPPGGWRKACFVWTNQLRELERKGVVRRREWFTFAVEGVSKMMRRWDENLQADLYASLCENEACMTYLEMSLVEDAVKSLLGSNESAIFTASAIGQKRFFSSKEGLLLQKSWRNAIQTSYLPIWKNIEGDCSRGKSCIVGYVEIGGEGGACKIECERIYSLARRSSEDGS